MNLEDNIYELVKLSHLVIILHFEGETNVPKSNQSCLKSRKIPTVLVSLFKDISRIKT
jgi:hypothetical protein